MSEQRIWELLTRQFNNEISEAELKELQLHIQNSGDENLSPELLAKIHFLNLKPAPDEEARRKNSLDTIRHAIRLRQNGRDQEPAYEYQTTAEYEEDPANDTSPKRKKARVITLLSAAACIAAFITGYYLFKMNSGEGKTPPQFETIVTRAGSKTLINLPDSSTVLLNSACKFGYNKTFGTESREIELAGEAYFDIRKSAEVPLVVHAGDVIIRVLGTTFNVRANPEDSFVEATLIKGIIEVSLRTDPERKILLRPNEKILIRKSEDLPANKVRDSFLKNKNPVIAVTKVEPDAEDSSYIETIWTRNKMQFQKEHFATLARKMERWYNVRMVLTDISLNDLVFTGSLEKESLPEALNALQHVTYFNYKIKGQTVSISK
ncbi:FecR family protein [Flavitalea flava]